MAVDTEAVMSALFGLLAPLSAGVSPPGPFKTLSRRLLFVEDMGAEVLPAVFQNQVADDDQFATNVVYATDFDVEWYVYCFQGNTEAASTPILNPLVDAVKAVLPPNGGPIRLSSGKTVSVFRAGKVHYFEGLLGERAVARIPLRLKATA